MICSLKCVLIYPSRCFFLIEWGLGAGNGKNRFYNTGGVRVIFTAGQWLQGFTYDFFAFVLATWAVGS